MGRHAAIAEALVDSVTTVVPEPGQAVLTFVTLASLAVLRFGKSGSAFCDGGRYRQRSRGGLVAGGAARGRQTGRSQKAVVSARCGREGS